MRHLALRAAQLRGLGAEPVLQSIRPRRDLFSRQVQIAGHGVERLGQLPDLVVRTNVDARIQISASHALSSAD